MALCVQPVWAQARHSMPHHWAAAAAGGQTAAAKQSSTACSTCSTLRAHMRAQLNCWLQAASCALIPRLAHQYTSPADEVCDRRVVVVLVHRHIICSKASRDMEERGCVQPRLTDCTERTVAGKGRRSPASSKHHRPTAADVQEVLLSGKMWCTQV